PLVASGFEAPPTTPLYCDDNLQQTTSPTYARPHAIGHDLPAGLAELIISCLELPLALFSSKQLVLQPHTTTSYCTSEDPRGMMISKEGDISLQWVRCPTSRTRAAPAAKIVERLGCRSLGITKDGEYVRAYLADPLDDNSVSVVEDALIDHGGAVALDCVGLDKDEHGSHTRIA
ncbi:hypothetical protein ZWY2020_057890, partial [Hordeum vulgare]